MVGNPQAYSTTLRVHQALWNLFGGRQHKGKRPGCEVFEDPIVGVADPCVVGDLREVPAGEREPMLVVQLPDPANTFQRLLVTDVAPKRVGRIRGIHQKTTAGDNFCRPVQQTLLRMRRVNGEILTHRGNGYSLLQILYYHTPESLPLQSI